MKLAMVLTPPSEHHLRLAAQVGVTDFVARYPSVDTTEKLRAEVARSAAFGLRLSVVEGYLPMIPIIRGTPDRDAALDQICTLINEMGALNVDTLCYNFMPLDDWTRTRFDVVTRGGALTNEFDLAALADRTAPPEKCLSAEVLWDNLAWFLRAVVPVAGKAGVKLALHPDDPPVPKLLGAPQIVHSRAAFERLFELEPGPANGMCLCTGTFGAAGADVPNLARHFGTRIHYVHFRNIRGSVPHFSEPFHDDGDLDMAAIMRALHEVGFHGKMRPDHVPLMDGERGIGDGYSMLGRLFAAGYLRGLMHATETQTL